MDDSLIEVQNKETLSWFPGQIVDIKDNNFIVQYDYFPSQE